MQFCKGFGGVGGILRYKVAFEDIAMYEDEDEFMTDSDED
jgi:peptide chain release factor subunit 1